MSLNLLLSGYLLKFTNLINGYQLRYFCLYDDKLIYYLDHSNSSMDKPRASINLNAGKITIIDKDSVNFEIHTTEQTLKLRSVSSIEKEKWICALETFKNVPDIGLVYEDEPNTYETESTTRSVDINSHVDVGNDIFLDIYTQMKSIIRVTDIKNNSKNEIYELINEAEQLLMTRKEESQFTTDLTTNLQLYGQSINSITEEMSKKENAASSDEEFVDAEQLPFQNMNLSEALWDDQNFEEDNGELDMQGNSIITHLISQVKIGMDLTKITLPTFILERRSCLEMFADFLSHPDIFKSIPHQTTPFHRMECVLKWYLSCFHAGRKSSVPKKPYNPVIGEIFQCFYSINQSKITNDMDLSIKHSDGPVPWAAKDDVTFIAEQVSHHPPVSAFYAESVADNICLDGFVWTKSQFLGLSIAVHMVGKATLTLLDHDEKYVMSFPDGYGRSILTVPWFEMGGKCEIKCLKTNYVAKIEFLTKPFIGGKKDSIQAEIFGPDGKRPLKTFTGQWNGQIVDSSDKSIFIDTKSLEIYRKYVRSLSQQQNNESRKLWSDVTKNLLIKNMDEATKHKSQIEDKQRSEAKYRNENGLSWTPKFFKQHEAEWIYTHPLTNRTKCSQSTN